MSVLQRYAFQCKQSKSSHTFAKIDVSRASAKKTWRPFLRRKNVA